MQWTLGYVTKGWLQRFVAENRKTAGITNWKKMLETNKRRDQITTRKHLTNLHINSKNPKGRYIDREVSQIIIYYFLVLILQILDLISLTT